MTKLTSRYGRSSAKLYTAKQLLDTAVQSLVNSDYSGASAGSGLDLTLQLVAGPSLHYPDLTQAPLNTVRRLAGSAHSSSSSNSSGNSTAGNITLNEITQYQLNLWTGVFFALLVIAAIYGVATMDIGRDSLLYAKFQADTTSKID